MSYTIRYKQGMFEVESASRYNAEIDEMEEEEKVEEEQLVSEGEEERREPTATTSASIAAVANPRRKLQIWSWGERIHENRQGGGIPTVPHRCDLVVNLVGFRSEYNRIGIQKVDGRQPEVQAPMEAHEDFEPLMQLVIAMLEAHRDWKSVAFVCSWGKHRSVAFAEILKRDYYPCATVRHVRYMERAEDNETRKERKKAAKTKNKKKRRQSKF